jgi:hypothetical protein
MVRAILHGGVIKPLSSLPEAWQEGQELLIQEVDSASSEDWNAWDQEVAELAAKIPPEDHLCVEAALAEADREAKELVRRRMGLA